MKKTELKKINIDIPLWMVDRLDKEAQRLGINRKSVINFFLSQALTPRESPSEQQREYLKSVERSFAKEWDSDEDNKGFGKL